LEVGSAASTHVLESLRYGVSSSNCSIVRLPVNVTHCSGWIGSARVVEDVTDSFTFILFYSFVFTFYCLFYMTYFVFIEKVLLSVAIHKVYKFKQVLFNSFPVLPFYRFIVYIRANIELQSSNLSYLGI
jgi:hypothetical protein